MSAIVTGIIKLFIYPILAIIGLIQILYSFLNGVIFQFCWLRPASSVALIALLFNFTIINFLTFLVCIIGENALNLILVNIADGITMKRTFSEFINHYPNHYYEPIKIEQLSTSPFGNSKISKALQFILQVKPFAKFFHVWSDNSSDIFGNYNTRQMVGAKSWIFLPTSFPKVKGIIKFTLLHEIGHASISHFFYHTQGYFVLVYMFMLLLNIHSRFILQSDLIWLSVCIFLFWVLYLVLRKPMNKIKTEMFADRYALLCMKDESDYQATVSKIENNYLRINEIPLAEHIKQYSKLIDDSRKVDNELWEYVVSLFKLGGLPPVWVSAPIGVAIIYIGTQVEELSYQNLGLLFLLFALLPMIVYHFVIKYYVVIKASFVYFIQERQPKGKPPITFDDCF